MKTLTVRLPEGMVAQIEAEARARKMSKSDVVRERLAADAAKSAPASFEAIADLAGCLDSPEDVSGRKKEYLKAAGYGRNRRR